MNINTIITNWESIEPPCYRECAKCGEGFEQRREERCCCECRAERDE